MKKKNKLQEFIEPSDLTQIQEKYLSEFFQIWSEPKKAKEVLATDRRFSSNDWATAGLYSSFAATYLLNAKTLFDMTKKMSLEDDQRQKMNFFLDNFMSTISPANFMATNPEVQKKFFQTKGKSMVSGIENFLSDISKGKISQTDETAFEVGKNLAITEGAVIFENDIFQLIQYKNKFSEVKQTPILFVPPCINKYYILDLTESNSLVNFALENKNQVFLVSWKNINDAECALTWDDYVETGVITAVNKVCELSNVKKINTLGFCIGGTLLACAAGVIAKQKRDTINSITLMASLLEFSDPGILKIFIDESSISMRENSIGQKGVMAGSELASTFSFLRPDDLIWNYYVSNYLKGEKPVPFDLLYWNGDGANLPGPFYCWYLKNFYLKDRLRKRNNLSICGQKIDLQAITCPVYAMGAKEDHIVPCKSAFTSASLFGGKIRFILGASGHIAGCINPASKNKRSYWINNDYDTIAGAKFSDWNKNTNEIKGSWWTDWDLWLSKNNGKLIPRQKKYGDKNHKVIEKAPGRYVREVAKKF